MGPEKHPLLKREAAGDIRSVLVIDDHPLFCEALAITLESVLHLSAIDTANSLASGMALLDEGVAPDAIVLDLNLPDVSGVSGLLQLRNRMGEGTPVVVVSAMADDKTISAVLAAGAAGFIPKDSNRDTLIDAFRKIWSGELYTPQGYSPPGPGEGNGGADDVVERLASLTPQQLKILELLCEGKLNKQIAFELSIAETTVKAHVTAILRKLGVHSRTQAALVSKEAQFVGVLK